ncbi:hypothetical protein RND81_08G121400 [Saponaria officinalis]|uniref:Uncharacterized protein n=1 Tax=Saponaria officinalis TaxID=3572 RepID=A0AAW1J5L7_SAPOF
MDYLSTALCLLLAGITVYLLSSAKHASRSTPTTLPPGPPTIPIFGNLLSLGTKPHVSLAKLAKTYGPLMTLRLGRVTTVIISSSVVAKEMLQKNDVFFSNRTVIDAVRAINHHKNSLVWLPVSPQWRNLLKMCNTHVFSNARLDASQSLRRDKIRDLIAYVEKCSETGTAVNVGQAAFSTTLNLLSNTFFSVDLVDPNSELARDFKHTIRCIMKEAGKPNFADYFPLLRKLDPQGIRRRMSVHFQKMVDLFNTMIEQRSRGERPPGLKQGNDVLDALLGINQEKAAEIEPSNIPYLLVDLFSAGTDTTSSTLEWAMSELLHNKDKLKKAKLELDEIIGKGNPVEESHIERLPYLQAIVKETFRLHPAVPFLVPRKADTNVTVFGYTVPENAQILVNVWAIGRDPENWERPNSFEPERFVGSGVDVKGCDFELIPFGSGRRMCVGLPLAIRMIHLMIGSLIHGFEWKLEGGVLGEELDMSDNFAFTLEKAVPLCAIPHRA